MQNARLDELQARIKIAWRNINNLRYADNTTLMAESEEELKSLLMSVKVESQKKKKRKEKTGLKLHIKNKKKKKKEKKKNLRSCHLVPSLHSKQGEKVEAVTDFLFLGSKITEDGDCSYEISR